MANKFDIDSELVRKLAELLNETGLSEIEFESTGRRIRVARPIAGAAPALTVNAPAPAAAVPAAVSETQAEQRRGTAITSPMVGTIFLSPEPGAEPFVQVGDTISEGQTVMLIGAVIRTRYARRPVRSANTGRSGRPVTRASTAGPSGSANGSPKSRVSNVRPPARGRSPCSATSCPSRTAFIRSMPSVGSSAKCVT